MPRYICVGCGFERNDDTLDEETCPYCGEFMIEDAGDFKQEI